MGNKTVYRGNPEIPIDYPAVKGGDETQEPGGNADANRKLLIRRATHESQDSSDCINLSPMKI